MSNKQPCPMTPVHWFELALRVCGVWQMLATVDTLITIYDILRGTFRPERTPFESYFTRFIVHFFVGLGLFLIAPHLARLVYREDSEESPSENECPPE